MKRYLTMLFVLTLLFAHSVTAAAAPIPSEPGGPSRTLAKDFSR